MKSFKNVMWGLAFIVIGIIVLLNSFNITNIDLFFDGWWTLFIIIPSLTGLITDYDKKSNLIGLIIGVSLLLLSLDIVDFDSMFKLVIPLIFIIIGVSFIFKDNLSNKFRKKAKELNKKDTNSREWNACFSGQDINITDKFNGSSLNAIFGGITFDLRDAKFENEQVINATCVFGGIDIKLPDDVKAIVNCSSLFGGVDDKRKNANISDKSKIVYINSTCMFGGIDIK